MIKILFLVLIAYAIYKLVKGGYVSVTTPSASTGTASTAGAKVVSFLRSVF